jgi:uncharacterized membrane protein YdbT with pleckstrin-like domain
MKNNNEILNQYDVKIEKVWKDKKRYFGAPISFTEYSLSEDRIFVKIGLLNDRHQETLLYRIKDISVQKNFFQQLFGVGTVVLQTLDASSPYISLKSIKRPEAVKEMIHDYVERAKKGASIEQILG